MTRLCATWRQTPVVVPMTSGCQRAANKYRHAFHEARYVVILHVQNLMNSLWDIRIFLGLVPKESHCICRRKLLPQLNFAKQFFCAISSCVTLEALLSLARDSLSQYRRTVASCTSPWQPNKIQYISIALHGGVYPSFNLKSPQMIIHTLIHWTRNLSCLKSVKLL